jgi:biotin transport system substrate-specific component
MSNGEFFYMTKVHEGVLPLVRGQSRSVALLWIALFAALTSVGGMVRIPVPPVPFTLQTLFVYLSGDLLGSKRGALSQALFLVLGLIGIPVFAMGGGPGYILQPTFGYLLAFPIAAWIIGIVVDRQNKNMCWWDWLWANGIGLLIILLLGVSGLFINVNFIVQKSLSWKTALWSGAFVFLPGEIVKIVIAAFIANRIKSHIG